MIFIQRPAAPAFLTDVNDKWCQEIAAATLHYSVAGAGSYKFIHYRDSALKDELKKVFVKCAYCEAKYGAVYDGDVEHFRPKGKVKEKIPATPGYYWLANDWDNLFLSCQHCNQRREHLLDEALELESYGKADQFPLADETKRCSAPGSLDLEEKERLLLNPCIDKPEEHFEYEDKKGVMVPLTNKAINSVKVLALTRPLLIADRNELLTLLLGAIESAKDWLDIYNANQTAFNKEKLDNKILALENYTADKSSYAGMCRFFVKKFLAENNLLT